MDGGDRADDVVALARAIDAAADAADEGALLGLDGRCADLGRAAGGASAARVQYFRSNVHAALQDLHGARDWAWRQRHRERQILYLRRSAAHPAFAELEPVARAQIHTNLGNALGSLGRTFEAIAAYERAIAAQPRFAMATGNRGLARLTLARSVADPGHRAVVAAAAHSDLSTALGPDAVWDGDYAGARSAFAGEALEIERRLDVGAVRSGTKLDGRSLGTTRRERAYRAWALRERLFVNPLNDLGPHPIAAKDALVLPDHHGGRGDPPHFVAWFNQLKAEFATARLLLFEFVGGAEEHYADRGLVLVDTLDYPAMGVAVERAKLAFRSAYSLLDKAAGFLNAYLGLGDDPDRVSMGNLWTRRGSLRADFLEWPNLHLRALYWISFDVVGDDPGREDAMAPEAAELGRVRNVLEHRCLTLRELETDRPAGAVEAMSTDRFGRLTFQMLRLARVCIMHLALAVHAEEMRRNGERRGIHLPIELPTYRRP